MSGAAGLIGRRQPHTWPPHERRNRGMITADQLTAQADRAVQAFLRATEAAGMTVEDDHLSLEIMAAPHRPPSRLPLGRMAVYVFLRADDGTCLKVGKAGKGSIQRFTYQHYSRNSKSSLAKSLCDQYTEQTLSSTDQADVKRWMCTNLHRINFFLDVIYGPFYLNLLEAFMQCWFQPRFEGPASAHLLTRSEIEHSQVDQEVKDRWGLG